MAKNEGSKARAMFLFTVSFVFFLDILFEAYLWSNFEITFSKFIILLFSRLAGGMAEFIVASIALYVLYGIAVGILGLAIAKFLAEELGMGISAAVAGYVIYEAIISSYTIELRNYLLALLLIYSVSFGLGALFKKHRVLIRLLGGLAMFVYVAYYYSITHAGLALGFAFLFLTFITASVPLIATVGRTMELSVRRWLKRPSYLAYTIVFLILGIFFVVESIFVLLDGLFVALIYGYDNFFSLGLILFIASLFTSAVSLTAGDTLVVAAVVSPGNMGRAATLAVLYGLYFGRRRLVILLKMIFVVGLLILALASEEDDREKRNAELANIALYSISSFDILYVFYPYLAAIILSTDDDWERLAAGQVLIMNIFLLFAFGVYSAIYTIILALTASTIGAIIIAAILNYLYFVPLTVDTIAIIALLLFLVAYPVMGPMSAAARGYFVYELIREKEKEIEETAKKLREESKAPAPPPEKTYVEEEKAYEESLLGVRKFMRDIMRLTSKNVKERYGALETFIRLSNLLEDKAKGLELKRKD